MNKSKWIWLHYFYILALMAMFFAIKVYWMNQGLNEVNAKWDKKAAIEKYYDDKICAKSSCDTPLLACREYCYDKEVKNNDRTN